MLGPRYFGSVYFGSAYFGTEAATPVQSSTGSKEWLASNAHRPYPFIFPGTGLGALDRCLVDVVVVVPEDLVNGEDGDPLPATVSYIDLVASPPVIRLSVGELTLASDDPGGGWTRPIPVVPDPPVGYLSYIWKTDTSYILLVVDAAALAGVTWPVTLENRALCPSTVVVQPPVLRKLIVAGIEMDPDKKITWEEGCNASLKVRPAVTVGDRLQNPIELAFVPGAGTGRCVDCDELDVLVRRINGVGPDDLGNFSMRGDDCILWRPFGYPLPESDPDGSSVEPPDAGLIISNWCGPCCTCDDMDLTYRAARELYYANTLEITPSLYNARTYLNDATVVFNRISRTMRNKTDKLEAFVRITAIGAYVFSVQGILVNGTAEPVTVSMEFEVSVAGGIGVFLSDDTGAITGPGDVHEEEDPGAAGAVFTFPEVEVPQYKWRMCQFEVVMNIDSAREATVGGLATADLSVDSADDEDVWDEPIEADPATCTVKGVSSGEG